MVFARTTRPRMQSAIVRAIKPVTASAYTTVALEVRRTPAAVLANRRRPVDHGLRHEGRTRLRLPKLTSGRASPSRTVIRR